MDVIKKDGHADKLEDLSVVRLRKISKIIYLLLEPKFGAMLKTELIEYIEDNYDDVEITGESELFTRLSGVQMISEVKNG